MFTGYPFLAQVIQMLTAEDYFNLSIYDATALLANSKSISTAPTLIIILIIGVIFDIYGRRITLFFIILIYGLSMLTIPYTEPNTTLFSCAYISLLIMLQPLTYIPCTQDYIVKEHLGKGIALVIIGTNLGSVLGLGVLLNVMTHFELSYKVMFTILGSLMILSGVATLFMVKEPS